MQWNIVENGKLPQIAVDCGNLIVGLQLLSWWKQVDVCKVLRGYPIIVPCKGYYCGTSGRPQGSPRTPLGRPSVTCRRHVPLVYSLHDPRGLTSLRIRLLHNLSVPTIVSLQPLVYKVPLYTPLLNLSFCEVGLQQFQVKFVKVFYSLYKSYRVNRFL